MVLSYLRTIVGADGVPRDGLLRFTSQDRSRAKLMEELQQIRLCAFVAFACFAFPFNISEYIIQKL